MCRVTVLLAILLTTLIGIAVSDQAEARQATGKSYALLVGVREYKNKEFRPLKYTENDVEKLAELLKAAGYQVRMLTTKAGDKDKANAPTAENIRKAFAALIKSRGKGDTVLLALSGHGIQVDVNDPEGEKKQLSYGYFCPQDATTSGIKYSTGHSDNLILVDELMEGLGKCSATTKLMLMDACRNEVNAKASSRDVGSAAERNVNTEVVKVPRGVAALFSCSRGQQAWEHDDLKHGVFFHYVIEGMKGKAKNESKTGHNVTWDRLSAYVKDEVAERIPTLIRGGAKQTPHGLNNLEGNPILLQLTREQADKSQADVGLTTKMDSGWRNARGDKRAWGRLVVVNGRELYPLKNVTVEMYQQILDEPEKDWVLIQRIKTDEAGYATYFPPSFGFSKFPKGTHLVFKYRGDSKHASASARVKVQ